MELTKEFNQGVWNLSSIDSIPSTAIVESITISWRSKAFFDFSSSTLSIFNEKGMGAYLESEDCYSFFGERVRQVWSWSSQNMNSKKKTPILKIHWFNPVTQDRGFIKLISADEVDITNEKPRNKGSLIEEGVFLMKVTNSYQHTINSKPSHGTRKSFKQHLKDKITGKERDEFIRSEASIILDSEPLELVDPIENEMTIQKGIVYSLGLINGRPLHAMLLTGGGIDTNFNPRIEKVKDSEELTAEQKNALEIFKSYSKLEHMEAGRRIRIFGALSQIADGIRSAESFNQTEYIDDFEAFALETGLDISRSFSLNGTCYEYREGKLIEIELKR